MNDVKRVAILGCGPAGLFAAHAAELAGFEPFIISKKRKSELFGAQYLHHPIPEVSGEPFQVTYTLEGSVDAYKRKVYGANYRGTVSPDELSQDHEAWNIRSAYDVLWARYEDRIEDVVFSNPHEIDLFLGRLPFNHYVSTIPAPLLCADELHSFSAARVWAQGDAPERGQAVTVVTTELNTVVCSGLADHSWYRKANILGYNTVEWPTNRKPPFEGVAEVLKPTATNCDCLRGVHRVGRYGLWTKGVLSHEAFYQTYAGLAGKPWS